MRTKKAPDPARLDEPAVRARAAAVLATSGGSLRALARKWQISPAYLSDFLNGRRGPGPQILSPLGLEQVRPEPYYVETKPAPPGAKGKGAKP